MKQSSPPLAGSHEEWALGSVAPPHGWEQGPKHVGRGPRTRSRGSWVTLGNRGSGAPGPASATGCYTHQLQLGPHERVRENKHSWRSEERSLGALGPVRGPGEKAPLCSEAVPTLLSSALPLRVFKMSKIVSWDLPGGPVVETPHFQCRELRFNPRSGNYDPS